MQKFKLREAGSLFFPIRLRSRLKHAVIRIKSYVSKPRIVLQTNPVLLSDVQPCKRPIFIMGVHRSGTSLLRRIIDSHSHIACPPETYFLSHFASMVGDPNTFAGFAGLGYEERNTVIKEIRRWSTQYHEAYRLAKSKPRWADKTPQYIEILDVIKDMFGDTAQFIIIFRHPLDVIYSIYKRGWRLGDHHKELLENTALYVVDMLRKEIEFLQNNIKVCHKIYFELLLTKPEETLRNLLNFLGEPWEPQILSYYRFDHNFGTEDPIVRGIKGFIPNFGNWKIFSKEHIDRILPITTEVIKKLNYRVDKPLPNQT